MIKKLLLDLEIAGDIGDAVVLIYALSNKLNVHAITLLNPTEEELNFVKHMLDRYSYTKGLYVHYDKSIKNSNITHKLINEYQYKGNRGHEPLEALVGSENYIVLGNSTYTIPKLLKEKGFNTFVLQDVEATKHMMDDCGNLTFIFKDICHDSWVGMEDLKTYGDTVTFLKMYLLGYGSREKKLMHGLVTLFYIINNNLVETASVEWDSTHNPKSPTNTKISIGWDRKLFIEILNRDGHGGLND